MWKWKKMSRKLKNKERKEEYKIIMMQSKKTIE